MDRSVKYVPFGRVAQKRREGSIVSSSGEHPMLVTGAAEEVGSVGATFTRILPGDGWPVRAPEGRRSDG